MKNNYLLYALAFLAAATTANALKHLSRAGESLPLVMVVCKDVVVVAIFLYAMRILSKTSEVRMKLFAWRTGFFALTVSFAVDTWINMHRG